MAKHYNDDYLDELLDQIASRIYRRRQQTRVQGNKGDRTIDEVIDETGIGSNNETDNLIVKKTHILDCGHTSQNNLGGRCHYCDRLICTNCIIICSSCGHSLCQMDSVIPNFDGQGKSYCRSCADEITRGLRFRKVTNSILSFFISKEGDGR